MKFSKMLVPCICLVRVSVHLTISDLRLVQTYKSENGPVEEKISLESSNIPFPKLRRQGDCVVFLQSS